MDRTELFEILSILDAQPLAIKYFDYELECYLVEEGLFDLTLFSLTARAKALLADQPR
jgi:hypothetical protein